MPATTTKQLGTQEEVALNEAMAKLETALLSPLVSGELKSWVSTVHKASREVGQRLRPFIETILHSQYKEIAKADLELLTHVEKMIEADKALLDEYASFESDVGSLVENAPAAERDERKIAEQRERIEKTGTTLILHIKKQQIAASTWLSEAFYRDRGPVD